jgi:hypothetical protein
MDKIIKYSILLLLTFSIGCQTKTEDTRKPNNEDDSFLQYLEETFNAKSIIKEEMFIVIPCKGCRGCEQFIYSVFSEQLLDVEGFTLIICNPADKGFLSPKLEADNIAYDFYGKMSDYDFGYGYPTCIVIKDNVVIKDYTLSPEIIYWLNRFLMAN